MSIIVDFVTVGPFKENSFILWEEETSVAILIDPGDEPEVIISKIEFLKVTPLAILNSHAHLEHIGAVSKIKNEYSIPFYLHKKENKILEHYPEMCSMFGITSYDTPIVDHWITGDGEIKFNSFNIQYFETPGHTPGGTSYIINDMCFCGDTLFSGSIGRTDLPGGDYSTLIRSIKKMKLKLSPNWPIFPGHGPSTTMGEELIHNPFLTSLKD